MPPRLGTGANGITQSALVSGPIDGPPVLLVHGNALLATGELFPDGARPVVVGHSMGGGVAVQLTVDHPGIVRALMLESPLSPYGFGGTRDLDGTPTTDDFAGTGGGAVNPEFVRRLAGHNRSTEDAASPRNVMRATYVASPDAFGSDEDVMLDSMLSTVVGDDNYPGDSSSGANWPSTAPGPEACPPQPMVSQTRRVLDRYRAGGGSATEVAYAGVGHCPHIEGAADFAAVLVELVAHS